LPGWLGVALATVFGGILVVHLYHVIVVTGRERLWHGVHVLMATGMIVMFAPTDRVVVLNVVGGVVFAVTAVTLAGRLVWQRAHRHHIGKLWLVAVIDLAAMVYMFAMMDVRLLWLTVPLVGWFVVQATGWSTGWLCTVLTHGGLGGLQPTPAVSALTARTATGASGEHAHDVSGHTDHDASHRTITRAALALMSVGMAYMLIIMQFGVATTPGMRGM
jgi:hypothetical protein